MADRSNVRSHVTVLAFRDILLTRHTPRIRCTGTVRTRERMVESIQSALGVTLMRWVISSETSFPQD